MISCLVCRGKGFVKAAPVTRPVQHPMVNKVAVWAKAVTVPCFGCHGSGGRTQHMGDIDDLAAPAVLTYHAGFKDAR